MGVPHFATCDEASAAGYLIRLPPLQDYRGWIIGTDYASHRIRLWARERSGQWDYTDNPPSPIRVSMTGRINLNRGCSPSGKAPIFRWIRLPRTLQPREDLITVDDHRTGAGFFEPLVRYAHRSEWERAAAELRRRIDIKIDGCADIDLIER